MRTPEEFRGLLDQGVVSHVIRPLLSGKEADVFLVESEGEIRVAKVYKKANQRSFKHRSDYTEGRKVRNTRDQRALRKRSRYGKSRAEEGWRVMEVQALYGLHAAGVVVPTPYAFVDGVLIMELIKNLDGDPAPRMADLHFDAAEAEWIYNFLIREVVKMLCAGYVHGDLSAFNVLLGDKSPVIIDFPQVLEPGANRNAQRIFLRDVKNLRQVLGKYCRRLNSLRHGEEIWHLYEQGQLYPGCELTGRAPKRGKRANVTSLLEEIEEMERANREKRERLGLPERRKFGWREGGAVSATEARTPRQRQAKKPSRPPKPAFEEDPFADLDDLLLVEDT